MAFATVHDRHSENGGRRCYEQARRQDYTLFAAVREQAKARPNKVLGTDSTTSAVQKVPMRLEVVAALPTATGAIQKHVLGTDIATTPERGSEVAV